MRFLAAFCLALALGNARLHAQPEPFRPSDRDLRQIQAKLKDLTAAVNSLRAAKTDDDLLVDVEVCQRAAENILRFPEEFDNPQLVTNTLATLDRGLDRAQRIKAGKPVWTREKGRVCRAYRSRVDGVPQPYRVTIPASYDFLRPAPLYVYLHGRGNTDFEVTYLATGEKPDIAAPEVNYIQLEPFGRSNNGFHWAGETDVFEAIASVQKRYKIDPDRILLRGFSMGGVGAWHIGLHHPGEFAALNSGAGNTKSLRNAFLARIPPVAQATMRIYEDMSDCALNVFNLPTLGYGGEIDPQLQASVNVREQLEREGFSFDHQGSAWKARELRALFLVGPKTGHTMPPPDIRAQIEAFLTAASARGRVPPDHIRFVTYTTRYGRSYWLTIAGLQQHYQRAEVDARRDDARANYTIRTKNVSRLLLSGVEQARKVSIDGDTMPVHPGPSLLLENVAGHWRPGHPDFEVLRKRHGLQGPIDDAFMDSFLCVRPTGQPLNPIADEHARKELDRFARLFAKFFRGDARVKDDTAVTAADIADNNIVLFGDPGSNRLIARVIGRLPVKWTRESIVVGERTYAAADHLPVLIYPNPLNPRRYVVINTGHTADERDYHGDYLLPRFGDYAVLKLTRQPSGELSEEIAESGLFDEAWRLPAAHQ
jgi:pimeloyl-ACP methyl ester carboxylesterase